MPLQLRVEAFAGSTIDDTARDAIYLANRLGITVMFKFNSVECMARPGDDPEKLAMQQQELQNNGEAGYKLARGN